jgi:hypothetical protein
LIIEKSLHILSLFSECSGLKVNLDKTEAIWIGSKHGPGGEYILQNNITWNHTSRFKLFESSAYWLRRNSEFSICTPVISLSFFKAAASNSRTNKNK